MSFTGSKLQFARSSSQGRDENKEKPKLKFTDFCYHAYQPRDKQPNGKAKKAQPRPKAGPTAAITTWRKTELAQAAPANQQQVGAGSKFVQPQPLPRPQQQGRPGFPLHEGGLQPMVPNGPAQQPFASAPAPPAAVARNAPKVEPAAVQQQQPWAQFSAPNANPAQPANTANEADTAFMNDIKPQIFTFTPPTFDAQAQFRPQPQVQAPAVPMLPQFDPTQSVAANKDAALTFFRYLTTAKANLTLQLQLVEQQTQLMRSLLTPDQLNEVAAPALPQQPFFAAAGLPTPMLQSFGNMPAFPFPMPTFPLQAQCPLQESYQAPAPLLPYSAAPNNIMVERRDSVVSTATTVVGSDSNADHYSSNNIVSPDSAHVASPASVATPVGQLDTTLDESFSIPWTPEFDPSTPADEILEMDSDQFTPLNDMSAHEVEFLELWP